MTETPPSPDRLDAPTTEAGKRLWEHWTDLSPSPTVDLWWRQTIAAIEAEARAPLEAEVERLRRLEAAVRHVLVLDQLLTDSAANPDRHLMLVQQRAQAEAAVRAALSPAALHQRDAE